MIPELLLRKPEEDVEAYLWRLVYEYKADPNTLRIGYNYTDSSGEKMFSKQMTIMDLWGYQPWDRLPSTGYHQTRTEYIHAAQHRTILPIEITFDIDDRKMGDKMFFPSIKAKAQFIIRRLRAKEHLNPCVYFTGNKSYHLTCIVPRMAQMTLREREEFREHLLMKYACDLQSKSENCLIAIEGATHYRSGKPKVLASIEEE